MSDRATGGGFPWPVSLWLLATMAFAAVSIAILGDVLSPSLLLDLVAFWPFVAIALVAGVVGSLRGGMLRVVAPVAVLSWLATTMVLHLAGAGFLPSVAGHTVAGVALSDIGAADLVIGPVDAVEMGFSSDDQLVSIDTTREGGDTAPAVITPFVGDGRAEIVVSERTDPGYFLFSGWVVRLGIVDSWTLDLQSNRIALSTAGARQLDLTAVGDGRITLSHVPVASVVNLTGGFEVTVPPGIGVAVEGEATVPDDWTPTDRGSRSPQAEVEWTVTVVGGSEVAISYQGS